MATITGYTAVRMKQIEDETVVDSYIYTNDHLIMVRRDGIEIDTGIVIDPNTVVSGAIIGDNLILTRRNATTINAGTVRGEQGVIGPAGPTEMFLLMGA